MSRSVAIVVHLLLVALQGANAFLFPVFTSWNPAQMSGVSSFVAMLIAAIQTVLGIQAYALNPSGTPVAPPEPLPVKVVVSDPAKGKEA